MKDLLFLVHRIPYPPNKGDKIRSFHLLKALASKYRVHLGTFIDTPEDEVYVEPLRQFCASMFTARINPLWRRLMSLRGILFGQPLTDIYYRHSGLAAWCKRIVQEQRIDKVVAFSSSMAQFARGAAFDARHRVIDFCDLDSDKWRQYAERHSGMLSWVYGREARLLLALEREITAEFAASLFVSDAESETFRQLAPQLVDRVHTVRNGVDQAYFDPSIALERPAQCDDRYVVFTGAMDYWANVEGVTWFARDVWPRVREELPAAKFLIVGSKPVEAVTRLATVAGVVVTGSVPDVRPYLKYAHAAVAPLRVARGIQNKVLEAMSMERLVIAASAAVQGLDGKSPDNVMVTDDPGEFAKQVVSVLRADRPVSASVNRNYVTEHFGWERNLRLFLSLVEGPAVSRA